MSAFLWTKLSRINPTTITEGDKEAPGKIFHLISISPYLEFPKHNIIIHLSILLFFQHFMAPFYGSGWFNCLKAAEPLKEVSWDLRTRSQEFLVLVWLTFEGWKAESTLETKWFWARGSELIIQHPNHSTTAQQLLKFQYSQLVKNI